METNLEALLTSIEGMIGDIAITPEE